MAVIKKALIIAAGNGSRLQSKSGLLPKPLTPVCGVALTKRLLITCKRAGIESCAIVVGYQGEVLKQAIDADSSIGLAIDWVDNKDWKLANGLSVHKAKDVLQEDFVLLMSDHLFDTKTLARLIRRRPSPGEVILAVDRKISQVYDIDDATKVQTDGSKILAVGKNLENYNAIDSGMFLCTPAIFQALEESMERGRYSLSEGLAKIIAQGKVRYFDIKEGWWLDIDTPTALRRAEKTLLERLKKPTDGFVARHFNRPLSLRLTRFLAGTPVTGNHITLLNLFLGLMVASLFAWGSFYSVLAGAVLFQITSILGGCDGELAKLKLHDSVRGQFFDTLVDNVTFLAFLVGLTAGFYRQVPESYVLIVGALAIFDAVLALYILYGFARRVGTWSLVSLQEMIYPDRDHSQEAEGDGTVHLMARVFSNTKFAIRRDFFAVVTLVLACLGHLGLIFWGAFLATHLMAMAMLYGQSQISNITKQPTRRHQT